MLLRTDLQGIKIPVELGGVDGTKRQFAVGDR